MGPTGSFAAEDGQMMLGGALRPIAGAATPRSRSMIWDFAWPDRCGNAFWLIILGWGRYLVPTWGDAAVQPISSSNRWRAQILRSWRVALRSSRKARTVISVIEAQHAAMMRHVLFANWEPRD